MLREHATRGGNDDVISRFMTVTRGDVKPLQPVGHLRRGRASAARLKNARSCLGVAVLLIFFVSQQTAGQQNGLRDIGHRFAHIHAGLFYQ